MPQVSRLGPARWKVSEQVRVLTYAGKTPDRALRVAACRETMENSVVAIAVCDLVSLDRTDGLMIELAVASPGKQLTKRDTEYPGI